METKSIKSLAFKVLEGNHEGNQVETKSFPQGKKEGEKIGKSFSVSFKNDKKQKQPKIESCFECKHKETIQGVGDGCVYLTKGEYQNIWSLLSTLNKCPRGHWN